MNNWVTSVIFASILAAAACAPNAGQPEQPNMDHKQHNQPATGGDETTNSSQIQAVWRLSSQTPQSNRKEQISIQIQDNTGKPVEKFDISHEKEMHLIVVSKDLSTFQHLHPENKGNGMFTVTTTFPTGGDYKLIADFIPSGGEAKTESQWVTIAGKAPSPRPLQPETNLTKVVEGKEVTLSFDKLQSGKEVTMTFSFRDAATKKPITNLQQYLGAIGHVVIISSDVEKYIHNHPLEENTPGPEAKFGTAFPNSGIYKIWGQFQHNGKVFVVPFVIDVP
ncbi:hypothetical protein [Brevibacillus agri]|uniref:hypothetical protein n=1 Tax=Brevibacillus TaxID=55080 RepID=UPI0018CEB359|nr:hypothetical protein [Brevibacillus agri]MBG9567126.1 hypothetical protein [Brevibacillus agri]